ncbi:MAG TPA: hypothetical protein VFL41_01995 [Gaiellaceae bacterium]|nr:hypothetical protein [Gaiellaceae bacterium]
MKARRTLAAVLVALATAAVVVVAGTGSAGAAGTAPPSPAGEIAYYSFHQDGDVVCNDIFLIDASGLNAVDVTHDGTEKYDAAPNWSPDGTRVAFTRDYVWGGSDVYVLTLLTGKVQNVTAKPSLMTVANEHPTWAPDGRSLVFSSDRDGNFDLYRIKLGSTFPAVEQLTFTKPGIENYEADISPDGNWIAFSRSRLSAFVGSSAGIYVMKSAGGSALQITKGLRGAGDRAPAWSPNGTKIAFHGTATGNAELYMVDANGGNRAQLTYGKGADLEPSWAPNGGKLVFLSDRSGATELWTLDLLQMSPGPRFQQLTFDKHLKGAPDWLPARPTVTPPAPGTTFPSPTS